MWIIPFIGLFIGAAIGYLLNIEIPAHLVKYFSVAFLAALDTIFGGIKSIQVGTFEPVFLITGFFTNMAVAGLFAYIGDGIGVDLYLAAVFAFGIRIFGNISKIRRNLICKYYKKECSRCNANPCEDDKNG